MTKLQLLHRALNERLMAAVEQIMEMVGGTVLEYEEETIRARKENEVLRRRLRWMEGANPTDWPDDPDPSQQDECAVNFTFEQGSEALVIKTETTDHPLYNAAAVPQSVDQGADVAGTSTGISCGMGGGMTWDSAQSYMAPLDFDPTSGNTRVRHWRGRNRRQRMSFACPDCGKVFGREQRLMIHMRIHSNERPYKYRRRKAFFYGDNKKKRKLQALSQLSGEIVVDLSDCSEQTNRSSASPEQLAVTAEQKEGPGGLSTESDHSDKETENRTTTPACHQRKKKRGGNPVHCYCPHCPDRVFARPCQLAMHMKTHTVKALVNLPSQAQSGTDEKMDLNLKSQKFLGMSKERTRRYRERLAQDEARHEEILRERRRKYQEKKAKGDIKPRNISSLPKHKIAKLREEWKKTKARNRKKEEDMAAILDITPPSPQCDICIKPLF